MEVKINQKQLNLDVKNLNNKLDKQANFAGMKALNNVAFRIMFASRTVHRKKFKKPKENVIKSVAVKKATRKNLKAIVYYKDWAASFMWKHIEGGIDIPKGNKVAFTVPWMAKTKANGSLRKNYIKNMLARPDVFSKTINGIGGLWQRQKDGGIKLLVAYEKKAVYKPIIKFYTMVHSIFNKYIDKEYAKELKNALKTAR